MNLITKLFKAKQVEVLSVFNKDDEIIKSEIRTLHSIFGFQFVNIYKDDNLYEDGEPNSFRVETIWRDDE